MATDTERYLNIADDDEAFAILDVYDDQARGQPPVPDALATISAGERVFASPTDKVGRPAVSRDGTIYLHDSNPPRAPKLAEALAATGNRKLIVAFPFDDPRGFLQKRYVEYTASALKVYGDEHEIREIVDRGENARPEHVVHLAGTPDYERLRARCKVSVSLYFTLADWQGSRPRILFPDGLGLYRLRTTSRHSLRNITGQLRTTARFAGGLAGVPFELSLVYREVADPRGQKRTIPVWSLLFKPPETITLSTRTWAGLRDAALAEGKMLAPALGAPRQETWAEALAEGDVAVEPSDADIATILRGDYPADADHYNRAWHSTLEGTSLGTDAARHTFVNDFTDGDFSSLSKFLAQATNSEAQALLDAAVEHVRKQVAAPQQAKLDQDAATYARVFAEDAQGDTPQRAETTTPQRQARKPVVTLADHQRVLEAQPATGVTPIGPDDFTVPLDDDGRADDDEADDDEDEVLARGLANEWVAQVRGKLRVAAPEGDVPASREDQRAVADAIKAAVDGDIAQAKEALGLLTHDTPGATERPGELTVGQVKVLGELIARDSFKDSLQAALIYADPVATSGEGLPGWARKR